ncbi:MAG: tRNA (uridine-2'-O-)-methyltransferase trm7 [Sporothrix epigloea]
MGKSSKDKRDAYYRLAKEQGWRARSAFKLLQLDEEFDLFSGVSRVVDLCAAPGSWSQVLSRVLIKHETFGRAAWQNQEALLRQQMLGVAGQEMAQAAASSETTRMHEIPAAVAADKRKGDVKIVAIDLQPISPLPGIVTLRADITHPATVPLLLKALDPDYDAATASKNASNPVDLVLSDGAPDVTGLHDLDMYVQSQLLFAALNLALCVLKPGGKFVAKIFRGRNVDLLFAQLKLFFTRVVVAKPRSSRASSVEAFIVCLDFRPPATFQASLERPLGVGDTAGLVSAEAGFDADEVAAGIKKETNITEIVFEDLRETKAYSPVSTGPRWIAPFVACGDLSAFDSDASYKLPDNYVSLDPVQPPTAPPYKRALEMRKAAGGAYGKTTV